MKSQKSFWQEIASLEKGRRFLVMFFVAIGAIVLYFFWSGAWLPKIESPGDSKDFNNLEGLQNINPENEEASRILTPLQGLADAAKSLGEIVPDVDEESETMKNIKSFSKKVWEKIYEKLP